MKEKILKIAIHCPIEDVFWFTTDPSNTPEWIDGIREEECFPSPPQVGITKYRNCGEDGEWTYYMLTVFEKNKHFELRGVDNPYVVHYTYKELEPGVTELTYHEWMTEGELENPFPEAAMERLKEILEAK